MQYLKCVIEYAFPKLYIVKYLKYKCGRSPSIPINRGIEPMLTMLFISVIDNAFADDLVIFGKGQDCLQDQLKK